MSWSTCEINPGVMRRQSGWRHEPGGYKACPNEAATSFLCLHKRSVWNCLIWCGLSVFNYSYMANMEPQGSGPAVAEAQRRLRSWGLQIDLSAELGAEVVAKAVDWPAEKEDVCSKKKIHKKGRTLLVFSCTTSLPGTDVFFPWSPHQG